MNQILSMGDNNNNNNSNSNINKIIVVFCIIIIVFALALGGIGGYKLINEKDRRSYSEPAPTVDVVDLTDGSAKIKVSSKSGVTKLVYTWDDGEENPIEEQSKMEIEEEVIVPNGNCTLNIKVIENNGRESKFKKEFIYDSNKDTIAPEIKIAGENKKVSIIVTDNKELDAIAYQWNSEKVVTIKPEEDKTTVKTTIDAKKGKNILTVVAKDKEGNIKKEEEEIIVASKPKISVTRSNGTLKIIATDEDELSKIQYAVNNKIETIEIKDTDKNKKQIEITEKLQKGENKIAVIVENKSGLKQTYVGKCTY